MIAGSAGDKIRSTARLAGEAALLSGLWATQRDDYPITVKTGHSIAELIFSPRAIDYTGIARPDAMILLSRDGVSKVGRQLAAMRPEDRVFALPDVAGVKTKAKVRVIDPALAPMRLGAGQVSLYCASLALKQLGVFPVDALEAAAGLHASEHATANAATIRAAK